MFSHPGHWKKTREKHYLGLQGWIEKERERKKKEMSSSLADNNVLTPQIPFLMLTVARLDGSEKESLLYRHKNSQIFFLIERAPSSLTKQSPEPG